MSASADGPQRAVVERRVLAAVLGGEGRFAAAFEAGLRSCHFTAPRLSMVFMAAEAVHERGVDPELRLVHEALGVDAGCLRDVFADAGAIHDGVPLDEVRSLAAGLVRNDPEEDDLSDPPMWQEMAPAPRPGDPVVVSLSEVTPEEVRWLWWGRIPIGKITLIDGDPGLGKSTLTVEIAARVSRGDALPGDDQGNPGGVVFLTAEDGLGDTLRPRLGAAGAELSRVVALTGVIDGDGAEAFPTIDSSLPAIVEAARRVSARLVVIDPLMAYLSPGTNSYRDQDVRRALAPLARAAEENDLAVLVVRHLRKSEGAALYRGGGSIGISGAARSVLLVAADPEDADRRVIASVKSNLSVRPDSLAFRLHGTPSGAARVVWEPGTIPLTADDLLVTAAKPEPHPARSEAESFLTEVLGGGPVAARDVFAQARQAGIREITVRRAKANLGVTARKGGMAAGWTWSLPDPAEGPKMIIGAEDDQDSDIGKGDHLRGSVSTFEGDQGDHLLEDEPDEVAL